MKSLNHAGFDIGNINKGILHPLWTWITAIKGEVAV